MTHEERVQEAFSKQSSVFDALEADNEIVQWMRGRVHAVVDRFLTRGSSILELNAGTGIDAERYLQRGYRVTPTDAAPGMVAQMTRRLAPWKISPVHVSYTNIDALSPQRFDAIVSNFGGLNCTADLHQVFRACDQVLEPHGTLVVVIMPRWSVWEFAGLVRGRFRQATRRLRRAGAVSNVEGVAFVTTYYGRRQLAKAAQPWFSVVHAEPLGVLCPPPHHGPRARTHPRLYRGLMRAEEAIAGWGPLAWLADHAIVVLRRTG